MDNIYGIPIWLSGTFTGILGLISHNMTEWGIGIGMLFALMIVMIIEFFVKDKQEVKT